MIKDNIWNMFYIYEKCKIFYFEVSQGNADTN